jgi:hypothetical protein
LARFGRRIIILNYGTKSHAYPSSVALDHRMSHTKAQVPAIMT